MREVIGGLLTAVVLAAASGQGVGAEAPGGEFRAEVVPVVQEQDLTVMRVEVFAPPGASVRVVTDGGGGLMIAAPEPNPGSSRSPVLLTVVCDRVRLANAEADAFKFLLRVDGGAAHARSSEQGPISRAEGVKDRLAFRVKSGTYREGNSVDLFTFRGVDYRLVVSPKGAAPRAEGRRD